MVQHLSLFLNFIVGGQAMLLAFVWSRCAVACCARRIAYISRICKWVEFIDQKNISFANFTLLHSKTVIKPKFL